MTRFSPKGKTMRITVSVELEDHELRPGDPHHAALALPPLARNRELHWSRGEARCPILPEPWNGNVPAFIAALLASDLLNVSLPAVLDTAIPQRAPT